MSAQGGALQRACQRRLPEDRWRDAKEHVRAEGGKGFVRLLWATRPQTWLWTSCRHQEFTSYLQKHDEVLTELEKATKRLKKLETVYKEFELQKVCYLPLNTFLLKPIQRLMHYKLILERLCKHYSPTHRDHDDCKGQRRSASAYPTCVDYKKELWSDVKTFVCTETFYSFFFFFFWA